MEKYSYLNSAFRSLSTILISFIPGDKKEKDETKDSLYTPDNKHQILCNNSRTLKEFQTNQGKYFKTFRTILESEINDYQTKGEYLFLLNNFITELRSIKNLINSESLSDSPAYVLGLVKFTDMPEGYGLLLPLAEVNYKSIPISIFAEHIKLLSLVINEVEIYITNLTTIIIATHSSDLPIKPNIPLKPDVSTLEEPLKFFNHFIFNNGFIRFKNKFFAVENGIANEYSQYLHTDIAEGYREYLVYNESGLPDNVKKVFFKDELKNLLDKQYAISIEFLDQLVSNNQVDSNKLSSILNFHLSNSLDLIEAVKKGSQFENYNYLLDRLDSYAKRMVHKYITYINPKIGYKVDPHKFEAPPVNKLTWNEDPQKFVQLFHGHIIKGTISLDGSETRDRIFEKLTEFFQIKPKSANKGRPAKNIDESGFLQGSTIITYFKNGSKTAASK